MLLIRQYIYKATALILFLASTTLLHAIPSDHPPADSMQVSTPEQAIAFLDSIQHLDSSKHWPNVDPAIFLDNLKTFAIAPLSFYEGKTTNFCAYSALTYIPLRYDPLGFSRFMIDLYLNGEAGMGKAWFRPSKAVKNEAGLLKYKGALDLSPAGQMWFLSLADRFKGYLNFFNRYFNKGDENTLWAATNFAKFNRMLRRLFLYKVKARGADLLRPWVGDRYEFLQKKIDDGGIVFLYLNNRLLRKKRHVVTRFGIPTHYVLLLDIYKADNGKVNIVYWDYGKKTLQQIEPRLLKKIIYGITYCTLKDK
jgi:hypothetical protein